jgi:uncharacterized protein YkwD
LIGISAGALFLVAAPAGAGEEKTVADLLSAHNRERQVHGRRPLKLSAKLVEAADLHARDMAEHKKLAHVGADGSTVAERVKTRGYACIRVGENVAAGQYAAADVMKAWMESPGHRENILADFGEMGAASAADSNGKRYWCVVFAEPMPQLDPKEAAIAVVNQLNMDRKAHGRPLLRAVPVLGKGAMALSALLAAKDSFKIGNDPFKVLADHGVETRGRDVKISLTSSAPTPEEAAKGLIGDDAAEIDAFREVGVGYAIAKNGTPYWCAVFSRVAPPKRPKGSWSGGANR